MTEDRYADDLPPRGPRVVKYDWARAVAKCRAEPGTWYLAFKNVPEATTATVRERKADALRDVTDGRFEVGMRNMRRRRGDLWMRFLPYTDEELMHLVGNGESGGGE